MEKLDRLPWTHGVCIEVEGLRIGIRVNDETALAELEDAKLRVLVADDNDDVRRAMITILQQAFDIVGEATTGRALVAAAPALAPDVIVSDVRMPQLTGLEAMRALRIAGHTPPFVLVTTDTENALEWINLGALGVVNKLNAEIVKSLNTPEFRERFIALGAEPATSTPQALAAYLLEQTEKMRKAVRDSGARPD